jgi:predicted RNase H-related nuclease YkuK (DUF458 family)
MIFTKANGEEVNVKEYIEKYMKRNPTVRIYMGTDAKLKRKKKTYIYVTTICFRHPDNGVHVIHKKDIFKINTIGASIFEKLWKEVEITVDVLTYLLTFLDKSKITVDLDYNVIKKHYSNKVHDNAKGWVSSLGVDVRTKPNAWAASSASDYLSNHTYKI